MLQIKYIRSRRRTVCLQIAKDGTVLVKMPNRFPKAQADRFVAQKMPWIQRNIEKMRALKQKATPLTKEEKAAALTRASALLPTTVKEYADRMGVSYGKIKIKFLKSKWGSCKSDGTLTFNALLGAVPSEVLIYVVVHELSHRKEMNHSPRFYAEMEKVLPDYTSAKKWLKNNGRVMMLRAFPDTEEKESQ